MTFERVEQESRPNKKVYEITDAGREVCIDALMSQDAKQTLRSDFMFMLSFAPYLPRARVAELLELRLADTAATSASLDELENAGSPLPGRLSPGQQFCVGLGRALIEAERSFILEHRDKLLDESPEGIDFKRISTSEGLRKVV